MLLEHIGEIPALTQGLGTFCQVLVNLDIVLRQPVNQFRSFIEVTVNTGFVSFHLQPGCIEFSIEIIAFLFARRQISIKDSADNSTTDQCTNCEQPD